MSNSPHASYRITFNLTDAQQSREYYMLQELSTKERNMFLHLAVGLLGRRIGYQFPKDGMMGVYASLMGNTLSDISIPDVEVMEKPIRKRIKKDAIPVEEKKVAINKASPLFSNDNEDDEPSALSLKIGSTLSAFDDEL